MASSAQTTNLFLLEDLDDPGRTGELENGDLEALQAIADWINNFVVEPHEDLGRDGTVCPFVPGSLERKVLWLAPERIGDRDPSEVVELMDDYRRLLLDKRSGDGDDAIYDVIVVVFTDLPADRAKAVFDEVQGQLGVPSYVEDGILFGPYYPGNETPAIHNQSFRPFDSPAPFMFVRHGVTGDWEFFLDDDEWFKLWAGRYGESAAQALGERLRSLPWRSAGHP
jgi:hypothetical protein